MTSYFENLKGHQFMSLTTFRRSGEPVATPVWFVDTGDRLWMTTALNAGKIKRIRHTPRVTVAPCKYDGTVLGPAVEAEARILPPEEHPAALAALKKKYGVQWFLFVTLRNLFGRQRTEATFLEITPVG
ncbi:MAG: PPOX class F420-dependent oxidoreductase [Anaerolineae bacterium]